MLLENKVAIVYGAGGSIGGAIARAFGREGAHVFLAGRTRRKLDDVATDIRAHGGTADSAVVDALDEQAVNEYVDGVVAQTGRLDVTCNVIGLGDLHRPLPEISEEDFLRPIVTAMRTHFLTVRAAAGHMIERGSGVVLAFGGSGPEAAPGLGGFVVALDALEGLRRQWSADLGPHGVRVVTLKSAGVPETIPENFPNRDQILASLPPTLLPYRASFADVGDVAAFVASDRARSLTATAVNITCGALVD